MSDNAKDSLSISTAGGALATMTTADRNPAGVYLAGLAPRSRLTMRADLDIIAAMLTGGAHDARSMPWHMLRAEHTTYIRSELVARYAPATAIKMIAALRGTLRAAYRLGLMSLEDMTRACDLEKIKNNPPAAGRYISPDEISAMIAQCDHDWQGIRDAALIATVYGAGLRRAELVGLQLADYDGRGLAVMGKGRKARRVPLPADARRLLDDWIAARGDEPGPLFTAAHGGQMRAENARDLIWRKAKAAGITPRPSMHDFRRSYVSELLGRGVDLATVARLAGHASTHTTSRYDRRPDEAAALAVEVLQIKDRRER